MPEKLTADDFLGQQIAELPDTELLAALQVFHRHVESDTLRGLFHALVLLLCDERDRRRRDVARLEAMHSALIDDGETGEMLSE